MQITKDAHQNAPAIDLHHLHVLGQLFKELSNDALCKILEGGQKHQLEAGDYLFKQGDLENSLYVVLSGRLRAVMHSKTGTNILGDIGEGEPTGEFALFTNEPRMASVLAIRKTVILKISKEEYLNLVTQNPAFSVLLTGFLIKRLRRNIMEQHMSSTPKNIALINLQPGHDLSPWTTDIEITLEKSGFPIQVYNHDSQPTEGYKSVFDTLEQQPGLNILMCSQAQPEWSRLCLLCADLVIVATEFLADPDLYEIEKMQNLYAQSILNKKIYIVFLHEEEILLPNRTSRWLDQRKVNLHIHVRKNHPGDIGRFCRIISNRAIGIVLGGGGAKGYAHVGAVKALLEAGINIDFLGGTSAGALYGIGMSHSDFEPAKIDALCEASAKGKLTSNDFSWPVISIMSGKKMSRFMQEMFGKSELEDIWVNSYCVSTNFSSTGTNVHSRGLISKMVRASIAIPGVFPPVVIDGQLHVDGGVVDNLPIDPMYRYPVRHIIAISLSGLQNRLVDYLETPTARMLIWDKITRKRKYLIPGIGSLIMNSLTLNSRQKQENTKAKVSLYFEMDLKGVGLMDDKKWSQTIQKGYEQMKACLENLPGEEKFWLAKST
ncbi:MAG: patatin-like phospholipase family protein [Ferruginibacter sp.]